MTATPRVYTEAVKSKVKKAGDGFDVFSMDDEATYGPEFYRMGFGEAVEGGHLTDYKVLVIAVAENPVIEAYDDIEIEFDKTFSIQDAVRITGCWDGLADPTTTRADDRITGAVSEQHAAKRAIAFTNLIKSSQRVERYWNPVVKEMAHKLRHRGTADAPLLQCEVRHVDGNKNALERANTIAWLREGDPHGGCRIVSNARCLTEGIDVPALDAVIFLAPRQSQVDVIQAVGRVMRKAPDKDVGYVILPVVVPTGSSLLDDEVLSGSEFKAVWKVLKALRSHDERLDVWVNTADLTGKAPIGLLPVGLCSICGKAMAECGCTQAEKEEAEAQVKNDQLRLPFEHAIASRVVEMCGDRKYWDRWGKEVARITNTVTEHVRSAVERDRDLAATFHRFADQMEQTVSGSLPAGDLAQLVAQHVVTMPVFEALFAGNDFADRNPISKALNELLDEFKAADVHLRDETHELDRFYSSVRNRLEGAGDSDARLAIMLDVYESFFKEAMPADVQRLGIVYTPVELVDFMLRSVDAVLRKEFGQTMGSPEVHILDPFTGTGTFINRLLTQCNSQGEPFISDDDLRRKFTDSRSASTPGGNPPEIHANEIVLLAYYLAALKIEEGYRERTGEYAPFPGIVLTDTFVHDPAELPGTGTIGYNTARANQQHDLPIQVIVANPPWSAGQKSSGDDNPSIEYPHIAERVRDTYGRRHKQVTGKGAGKASGNLYVQAIRWASDRVAGPEHDEERPGVVAFVHPGSLSNAPSLAGMRAALRDEYTDLYVVNLRGDANKSGEEWKREGDKIFGQGSRNSVQITVLVRNPTKTQPQSGILRYVAVPEYATRARKFEWLAQLGDVTSGQLEVIPENEDHDWTDLTDGTFRQLLSVCEIGPKSRRGPTVVSSHALGAITNLDAYVYSFSLETLIERVKTLIRRYERTRSRLAKGEDFVALTENNNLEDIRWTDTLKKSLKRNDRLKFDESNIREVLYRPFTKLYLYEDHRIISNARAATRLFPNPKLRPERERERERERESICVTAPNNRAIFGTIATVYLPDVCAVGTIQPTRAFTRDRPSASRRERT